MGVLILGSLRSLITGPLFGYFVAFVGLLMPAWPQLGVQSGPWGSFYDLFLGVRMGRLCIAKNGTGSCRVCKELGTFCAILCCPMVI